MNKKQLQLNEGKTECLLVGKKSGIRRFNEVQSLNVNGVNIKLSDKIKDLGVIVDKYLSFNNQINEVVRVARSVSILKVHKKDKRIDKREKIRTNK